MLFASEYFKPILRVTVEQEERWLKFSFGILLILGESNTIEQNINICKETSYFWRYFWNICGSVGCIHRQCHRTRLEREPYSSNFMHDINRIGIVQVRRLLGGKWPTMLKSGLICTVAGLIAYKLKRKRQIEEDKP